MSDIATQMALLGNEFGTGTLGQGKEVMIVKKPDGEEQ